MSGSAHGWALPFVDAGLLTAADVHAVALVAPRFGETDPERLLGLAFAVRAPRVGHAGVDLGGLARRIDAERLRFAPRAAGSPEQDTEEVGSPAVAALPWPDPATWQSRTLASPMVGPPEARDRPFVRQELGDGALLLTRRMYREQELVAEAIRRRAALAVPDGARVADLDRDIAALFPGQPEGEAARAVRLAAERRLAIVIGGPGTGKTFSITRLLAALIASKAGEPPVVRLAAPTGKAAVRMREAIREATAPGAKAPLDVDDRVRQALQRLEASTIHRLLGIRPDGSARHDAKNPVPADVIVVDEVSMVDLALMRRLVEAVPEGARLVLLGDRDQLASVEAGCVLADLVGDGSSGPLAGNVQVFTRSHRFESAPEIATVAACLQSYRTAMPGVPAELPERLARAVEVLARPGATGSGAGATRITWLGAPTPADGTRGARPTEAQLDRLAAPYTRGFERIDATGATTWVDGYAAILAGEWNGATFSAKACEAPFHAAVLDALEAYRVLAVHRRGPLGVAGLDRAIGDRVRATLEAAGLETSGRHWIGRPLIVTENGYDVGLMNGDVGLVLPTKRGPAAVFPAERRGETRVIALSRLPAHDTALAMTVHKSQGSQFALVAMVLAGRASPIETRELLYTAVTRAQNQLVWIGDEAELADALARPVQRASGLGALLRGEGAGVELTRR